MAHESMYGRVESFYSLWWQVICHSKTNLRLSCTKKSSAASSRCLSACQLNASTWSIKFLKQTRTRDSRPSRSNSILGIKHISPCAKVRVWSSVRTRFPSSHHFSDISNAMALRRTMQLSAWIETNTTRSQLCTIYYSSVSSSRVNFPQLSRCNRRPPRRKIRDRRRLWTGQVVKIIRPENKKGRIRWITGKTKMGKLKEIKERKVGKVWAKKVTKSRIKVQVCHQIVAIDEKTWLTLRKWSTEQVYHERAMQRTKIS